jgi:hypothetical protein
MARTAVKQCEEDREVPRRDAPRDDYPNRIVMLGKFYGQATKGVRWMPWRQQAMKDAVSCEKLRGAANRL